MQETQVQSLSQEDPLEEETATHSSILDGKIPWIEEPGGLQSMGSQRVRHDWATEHKYKREKENPYKNSSYSYSVPHISDAILSVLLYQFNEFSQQSNLKKKVLLIFPFYGSGNWSTKKCPRSHNEPAAKPGSFTPVSASITTMSIGFHGAMEPFFS